MYIFSCVKYYVYVVLLLLLTTGSWFGTSRAISSCFSINIIISYVFPYNNTNPSYRRDSLATWFILPFFPCSRTIIRQTFLYLYPLLLQRPTVVPVSRVWVWVWVWMWMWENWVADTWIRSSRSSIKATLRESSLALCRRFSAVASLVSNQMFDLIRTWDWHGGEWLFR